LLVFGESGYEWAGGSGGMEIHEPKPVHGWREFLGEIGITVGSFANVAGQICQRLLPPAPAR
jgi:hypothetical protein